MRTSVQTLCVAVLCLMASPVAGSRYRVDAIRDVIGERSNRVIATAINNSGQLTGSAVSEQGGIVYSFFWDGVNTAQLPDFQGGKSGTIARDLNDSGQITGETRSLAGRHAFLWDDGVLKDLTGSGHYDGEGINSSGDVVISSAIGEAYVWSSQTGLRSLPDLQPGGFTLGRAINDLGVVVGLSEAGGGGFSAVAWVGGSIRDLGRPANFTRSEANAINNLGDVVGESQTAVSGSIHRATLWANGDIVDLGELPGVQDYSLAYDINDDRQIVGYSVGEPLGSLGRRATLWDDGQLLDLNNLIDPNSGWLLYHADGINNRGEIIGFGRSPRGTDEGFLLTPVPEPSSLTLLAVFVGGIAMRLFCWRP